MRVNVYSQEIDLDTAPEIVTQHGTGKDGPETFYGIRFYLHSSERLHHIHGDDDRSAITFWVPRSMENTQRMASLMHAAYQLLYDMP